MVNRLGESQSPYLRQHADNPVHWQEWGEEALSEARERDVPILLSVGYAACHWCHVMAHESFEDAETAEIMNREFVCIKVDREERPDIDSVYMAATMAMTGHGGWPMTCFLAPDGRPFYCGTYYPKRARGGMPSFTQVLHAIADTWRTRRAEVDQAAASVQEALQQNAGALPSADVELTAGVLDKVADAIVSDEDTEHGGFGGAPKFPPSALLEGLLRHYERSGRHLSTIERTASAMARGGIYDQLGGGFARYSVDAEWVVPHFEKMLYDNALLLRFYAHLARRTNSPLAVRVAEETAEFLLSDLRTAEGGFASAFDADTEGVEGLTYVWTSQEIIDVLGLEDGLWAAAVFNVGSTGTFEGAQSVLQLLQDPDDPDRFARVRATLREARSRRPQPERDDKVVTVWNGFAISALAEGGAALGRREWVAAAQQAAQHLLDVHIVDGRLRRASLAGRVGQPAAALDDHAAFALGLLSLFQVTGEESWRSAALSLIDTAIAHFADDEATGAWFDTADDAEELITRPRDPLDGATPSGASLLADALFTAAAVSEPDASARYAELASATLQRAAIALARAPRSAGNWFAVAEAVARGPLQVAIALPEGGDEGLLRTARSHAPGGAVVVAGAADSTPLLAERAPIDNKPAAYVCRGFVCDRPVVDEAALVAALSA
ncbi:thioredoxin domain-containing protein [Hoyosella sp. YIM 151337]|uniref:thioredoxin domain-containing protein n=1 Tax=Hoyosella sp. YIM 151337 TaxID=2992742 RepID=UPI002235D6FC|nr:thioredoxin domain-containing protein [Hoyosella sp. YIM 151337]MCW4355050.1 thioredoxin domain-containing protein [Hoyosella sp. YIM 151337]